MILTLQDLLSQLQKHTDIKHVEVHIDIEPEEPTAKMQIAFPEKAVVIMAAFVQNHKLGPVTWTATHHRDEKWLRIKFPIKLF